MRKLILASASAGRKALLQQLGLAFEIDASGIEEKYSPCLEPHEIVKQLSLEKAVEVGGRHPDAIVIAADTIGVVDGRIIGKANNAGEARLMLKTLSGKQHKVITGFTIMDTASGKTITRSVESSVRIRKLTDRELEWYVATGEPVGKAGAYAVQGLGMLIVEKIDGDFSNVVGLPVSALPDALKELDLDLLSFLGVDKKANR